MKTGSYWATQIGVCAFFSVALPVIGVLLMKLSPEEPGRGFIMIVASLPIIGCLIWLIRSYRRMSVTQRAVYAWAISQLSSSPVSDLEKLRVAQEAQAGTIAPKDLDALIALNSGNPYPGSPPSGAVFH